MFSRRLYGCDYTIALAGNPNVGKTTIFNNLTGLHQHTGNWPGKTVSNAYGSCTYNNKTFLLVDLPGTYSLMSNSNEEEIARNYICFGNADYCVVVVDATCLERNLNLVLQILEMTPHVIVCVNLLDEAKKKCIKVDLGKLSELLGVPVIGTTANKKKTLTNLLDVLHNSLKSCNKSSISPCPIKYNSKVEEFIDFIEPDIREILPTHKKYLARWISLKLLDENYSINNEFKLNLSIDIDNNAIVQEKLAKIKSGLKMEGVSLASLRDSIVSCIISKAESIREQVCIFENSKYNEHTIKIDKILTSKRFGIPIMLAFLALIFWLTITGANYPSLLLSSFFYYIQNNLLILFDFLHIPDFFTNMIIYRHVSNCYLDYICYAPSYGYIFSIIYFIGGFRLSAKTCF